MVPDNSSGSTTTSASPAGADFQQLLGTLEDGRLVQDVTDQLRELVGAMQRHAVQTGGKPTGRLTLTLNLKLDSGIFEVQASSAVVQPKPIRGRSILYGTRDGLLSPNNPRQLEFGLGAAGPVRDVATPAAGEVRRLGVMP